MAASRSWKRVATVYALVEQMRSGELQAAAGSVHEVAQALRVEMSALHMEAARTQTAMTNGDAVERAIADTMRQRAKAAISGLTQIKVEREEILGRVAAAHHESRVNSEQMKSLVDRSVRVAAGEEMRATQAIADDRYAAQAWRRGKGRASKG